MTTTPNVAILRFSDTAPNGRPLLSISVTRHLDQIQKFTGAARLTIADCTLSCRMHPDSAVVDPAPIGRLDGPRVIAGEIISQFFKLGLANADYVLTYLVTFSDGSVEPFDAEISVRTILGI